MVPDAVLGAGDTAGKETDKSPALLELTFGRESKLTHIISNSQAALRLQRKIKQCRGRGIKGAMLERRLIREVLSEDMTFKQRPAGGEGQRHAAPGENGVRSVCTWESLLWRATCVT